MLTIRDELRKTVSASGLHDAATFTVDSKATMLEKAAAVGVLSTENEDVRSLREMITYGLKGMALLDEANTSRFGNPEITEVNIGVRKKPAILISGHDLIDLEQLLEQTKGTGVDVYTHSEMLPAHYYSARSI